MFETYGMIHIVGNILRLNSGIYGYNVFAQSNFQQPSVGNDSVKHTVSI